MTAYDPRTTYVSASAVGCMAHTVGPSIRWGPWDSQADHQLANTVVTIRLYKGPILSACNIQASIKYMIWADEGTKEGAESKVQRCWGRNNAHVIGQIMQCLI